MVEVADLVCNDDVTGGWIETTENKQTNKQNTPRIGSKGLTSQTQSNRLHCIQPLRISISTIHTNAHDQFYK